ncbi:hypothetical protein ACHAXT_006552 [Thalassiosira profunda]
MVSLSPSPKGKTFATSSSGAVPEHPLEMSDDAEPWSKMDVRSSEEGATSFFKSNRGLACMASVVALFIAAAYALFTTETSHRSGMHGSNNGNLVAPIKGQAYLTPDEFRDIRTAQPGESVLVTGGLGFIGSHVVDLLLHRGFDVTILDDESNGHNHNKYATELVPHDITVVGDLPAIPSGGKTGGQFTHVIHLAAAISVAESMNEPEKYERINYGGSEKVLQWVDAYNNQASAGGDGKKDHKDPGIRPIRRMVAASSAAVYGDPDPALLPLRESAPYGGLSPYADTKHRMEGLMKKFVDAQNDKHRTIPRTSAVALRFFNVYGPRQDPKNPYSGVISLFLEKAITGHDITILGDGKMTRDFVYVKDVARAIVLALLQERKDKDADFAVYNVCTGTSITINTLAAQIKQSMESESRLMHLEPRQGDIRQSSCNPSLAKEEIGFASAVSQECGLEKTANWFRLKDESRLAKAKERR